jgi:hypothetical protein
VKAEEGHQQYGHDQMGEMDLGILPDIRELADSLQESGFFL